jgi:hypothetical protein
MTLRLLKKDQPIIMSGNFKGSLKFAHKNQEFVNFIPPRFAHPTIHFLYNLEAFSSWFANVRSGIMVFGFILVRCPWWLWL